jgi:hypothetical protein
MVISLTYSPPNPTQWASGFLISGRRANWAHVKTQACAGRQTAPGAAGR